jgi:hypothetical protein
MCLINSVNRGAWGGGDKDRNSDIVQPVMPAGL